MTRPYNLIIMLRHSILSAMDLGDLYKNDACVRVVEKATKQDIDVMKHVGNNNKVN